jgi:anti-sigma B factor antagonist
VLTVAGNLDMATAEAFEQAVRPLVHDGGIILVDVAGVQVCDSTGLGAIVRAHRHAAAAGCRIAVRAPRPYVADLFAMTGLDKVIEVRPS